MATTEGDSPCCVNCLSKLPFKLNSCNSCGRTLTANVDYCGSCLHSSPKYHHCFCAFQYQPPIDEWIRQFKYGERLELAKPLAQLLATELQDNLIELPELLIPVPMHHNKLRQRGFNQALLLTQHLSRQLKIEYTNGLIEKHRATEPQASLSFRHRNKNIAGSFCLNKPIPAKRIALVDDVVTTGATASEISTLLKGVEHIQVWGVAHTI